MNMKRTTGLALATAAAAMFAATAPLTASAHPEEAKVNCFNVNSCKGKGSCKTANNACKGQNSCKGQGFVSISPGACVTIGGKAG